MTAWQATNLVAEALLPPFSLVLLLAAGLALLRWRRRLGVAVIAVATFALYALSTPWIGGVLLASLEISEPLDAAQLPPADAIVVLGGGRRLAAEEYGTDTLKGPSLERLRYGAHLHRTSGLPLLVTGGKPGGGLVAEGTIMQRILEDEYGIATRWVEAASNTTWDNARLSAPLLTESGATRIVLVTHAWHLRRAVPQFEAQGLQVRPAGIGFSRTGLDDPIALVPTPGGLADSRFALHEWLGILWYKARSIFAEGSP